MPKRILALISQFDHRIDDEVFPRDLRDAVPTLQENIHLILAGFSALFSILLPLIAGFGFRKLGSFNKLSVYSIISGIIILASGGFTALAIPLQLNTFGSWNGSLSEHTSFGSW